VSIKSGEMVHVGNTILVDRAQTAGISSLNQPQDRINELGNYQSVGIVRDVPDLTFGLESFDTSAALEAILQGRDVFADPDGQIYDLGRLQYVDVASPFKAGYTRAAPYDTAGSICIPFLAPEAVGYRFGLHDNASQTASLRGDSLFYAEGSCYLQDTVGTATAGQTIALANPAIPYNGDTGFGAPRYALSVSLVKAGRRLQIGPDYTETPTGTGAAKTVTVTITAAVPATETVRVMYQSPVVAVYPQASHTPVMGADPTDLAAAVKPAALRGKDISVLLAPRTVALDPTVHKLGNVQAFSADWRVNLERDEQLGSAQATSADYVIPDVTGSLDYKPFDFRDLMERIRQLSGKASGSVESIGPYQVIPVQLAVILHDPNYNGRVLKTLYCPDARFTLPTFQGRVNTKITASMSWSSESGVLKVSKGLYPFTAP
jgi:hypothetical protein